MSSSKRILLTGALGMLGRELAPVLKKAGYELLLTDCREFSAEEQMAYPLNTLDITDCVAVGQLLKQYKPEWVVNCAAYTNVDRAETDYDAAFAVNSIGPANLAQAAKLHGSVVLHISTDYVYGGNSFSSPGLKADTAGMPWRETSVLAPCGIYGHSKRLGDELLQYIIPQSHLILRTSWLHGIYGPNFINSMLRLAKQKPELRVVSDQIGSPTWSYWLAQIVQQMIERNARGIFNASSRGNISWFDFAAEVFRQAGLKVKLCPQTSAELGRPAPRPFYSTLDVSKLESFLGISCPDWQTDISGHLALIFPEASLDDKPEEVNAC